MRKKLGVALAFGLVGPVIYALTRWEYNKEILAIPVFLIALATFGFGLAFAYFFDSWESSTISSFKNLLFVLALLIAGIAVGIVDKAWPAEPSNAHRDALPAEPVNSLPEVESWLVVEEETNFDGPFIAKFHRNPSDPKKWGFTIWFPDKNKNYEYEVFVRMIDFVKNGPTKVDNSQMKGSIKLQNGNWSEIIAGRNILMSRGLLNGELAVIFRVVDDSGETKFFRAFLLKDLVKPKN